MKKLLTLLAGSTLAFYMQGCSDSGTSADDDNPVSKGSVYVFGSDQTENGELRWIDEDGKISKKSLSFYQDSRLRAIDGKLFVLEGFGGDNIALLDPEKDNKVLWENKLGANANPYDVVKANKDEVWVALRDNAKFIKVAVKDGKLLDTVKTEDFCQGEKATPELVDFETSGDTLFALFQRSDENWGYPAPGLLAMYKLNDGKLLDTVRLAKKNPFAMGFAKGKLYVASTGEYSAMGALDPDGARGIEVVDLAKKKSSMVVDGKALGGGVQSFAVNAKDGYIYVGVMNEWGGEIPLMEVNLEKKSVKKIDGVSNAMGSLLYDEKTKVLYIGDRDYSNPAVYTYEDGELTKVKTATKDVLPPYGIAIVR